MGQRFQAVILAAGRGSRLGDQGEDVPKSLLPIGPRSLTDETETSFLRRHVELLATCGVEQVVVVVGYQRQIMIDALREWGPDVQVVVNPTPDIQTSGSLHSFQFAARAGLGILDGSKQTLLMDADIVYQRSALQLLLDSDGTTSLLCRRFASDGEEVLVYGTLDRPRFLGKGLTRALVGDAECLGEATGIIKIAPDEHAMAREMIDWLLGDPDAPEGSNARNGFGPARRATEHEDLSQQLMHLGRMRCLTFGEELLFMEVDTPGEYNQLRESVYPALLRAEARA